MRLICPNCDAQYEVPDEVIPTEGRDVQCSDCGKTWFQPKEDLEPEPPALLQEDSDDQGKEELRVPRALAERAARKVDPEVQAILQEEAELESQARAADALEDQPELALDESDPDDRKRAEQSRKRMAMLKGEDPKAAALTSSTESRRDLLPDIEEINSTLRSTTERGPAPEAALSDGAVAGAATGNGFWTGFVTVVALASVLVCLYVFAPQIARAVPQADPLLTQYVTQADNLRSALNGSLVGLSEWLEDTAASQTTN
jgi:predicted Zn finger-like uncharacterized protein